MTTRAAHSAHGLPPTLTTRQAAWLLGHHQAVVRRNCAAGRWPAVRTAGGHWRILTDQLLQVLSEHSAWQLRRGQVDLHGVLARLEKLAAP